MRIRDKTMTAACLTPDGIEWTTLKVKQEGSELVEQNRVDLPEVDHGSIESAMASVLLPDEVCQRFEGDLTASIRTSELLMRTMEFPTKDPVEISGMVDFQIDKISPFPLDQLAVSHEILGSTENGAMVLMAAARHECIDAIGETFKQKGIYIHSIDARILGWLHLLNQDGHISDSACEILIVDDGIDYALTVLSNGIPLAFRSLPRPQNEDTLAEELASEISYTLTMLDAEHELPLPAALAYWNHSGLSPASAEALQSRTGLSIEQYSLASLPPLSQGIIERAIQHNERIELIPQEWIEYEKMKRLKKKFLQSSAVIGSIWLLLMLIFTGIYQTRAIALSRVQKKEATLKTQADRAIQNRRKLRALKDYADRSDSALECLREVTRLLPAGDIEFASFNYNKEKGVTLRGTAESDDMVYEYWDMLTDSGLFTELKDQRINNQVKQGVQRAVFSVNLLMTDEEDS